MYFLLKLKVISGSNCTVFSSPELKVSYCDRLLSGVVRCASCVNIFSFVTSWTIGMKLHRKYPLNDRTRILPNLWNTCRILATKGKELLLQNWLADFQIILKKWSLGYPLSDSFNPC